MSSLLNWTTTRPSIRAGSTGAMSISGRPVTTMPPTWMERWRGKPCTSSTRRRKWPHSAESSRSGALAAMSALVSRASANQRSTPLARRSIRSGGKPSALPTWRMAMRGRNVTTLQTIPVRSQPYVS